jgi:hypothetical protein
MRIVRLDQIDNRSLRSQVGVGVKIAPAFSVNFARLQKFLVQDLAAGAGDVQGKIKPIGHAAHSLIQQVIGGLRRFVQHLQRIVAFHRRSHGVYQQLGDGIPLRHIGLRARYR